MENTEEIKVTPLIVRKAQNAPEHIGSGYPISEIVFTTSS
jgi:hypothetical protein